MKSTIKTDIKTTIKDNSFSQSTNPRISIKSLISWDNDLNNQRSNDLPVYNHSTKVVQGSDSTKFAEEKQLGTGINLQQNIGKIPEIIDTHGSKKEDTQVKTTLKKQLLLSNASNPDEEEISDFNPDGNPALSRDELLSEAIIQVKYMLRIAKACVINKLFGEMIKPSLENLIDKDGNLHPNTPTQLREVHANLLNTCSLRKKTQQIIDTNLVSITNAALSDNAKLLNDWQQATKINNSLEQLEESLFSVFKSSMSFLEELATKEIEQQQIRESQIKYKEVLSAVKGSSTYSSLIMELRKANDKHGFDKDLPLMTMSFKNLVLCQGFWLDGFLRLFNVISKINDQLKDQDYKALYVDQREAGFLIVEHQENVKGIGTNNLQQCVAVIFDGFSKKSSSKMLIALAHVDVNTNIESLDDVKNLFDTKQPSQIIVYQNGRLKQPAKKDDNLERIKESNLQAVQKQLEKWKDEINIKILDDIFPSEKVKEDFEEIVYIPKGGNGNFELKVNLEAQIDIKSAIMRIEKRIILDEARGVVCDDLAKSEKKYPLPLIDLSQIDNCKAEDYLEDKEAEEILELFRTSFDHSSTEKGIFTPWMDQNFNYIVANFDNLKEFADKLQTRLNLVRASLQKKGKIVSNEASIAELITAFNELFNSSQLQAQIEHLK